MHRLTRGRPGIGDEGRAGVGEKSDVPICFKQRDDFLFPLFFIEAVIGEERFFNAVVFEERGAVTRIFAEDLVARLQCLYGTARKIAEISDGGGYEI